MLDAKVPDQEPMKSIATESSTWRVRTSWGVLLGLFIVLVSPNHYRDDVRTANESARIDTAIAIVDHGTIDLTAVWDERQPGWRSRGRPLNVDVAQVNGRYVIDKGPLLSVLAVPWVALDRFLDLQLSYRWLAWWLTVLLSAVPTVLWFSVFCRTSDNRHAELWALAAVIATPWWTYGGLLFSHAFAASLCGIGAILALGNPGGAIDRGGRARPFVGGLCLGLSVLAEYPAALCAIAVVVAVLFDTSRRSKLFWTVVGGLGPALLLLLWNWSVFGGPLTFSYGFKANEAMAATHGHGLYGISLPTVDGLFGVWLSAGRGLLFMAPWLVVGVLTSVVVAKRCDVSTAWRILLPIMVVVVPCALAGFGDWHGGRATGPRYALFAIPFFVTSWSLVAPTWSRYSWASLMSMMVVGVVVSSVVVVAASALVMPYLSELLVNPLFEVNVPAAWSAGGADTLWRPLLGRRLGCVLVLGLGLGLTLWAGCRWLRDGYRSRPTALSVALGLVAIVGHLMMVVAPSTPGARSVVEKERRLAESWGRQPQPLSP